MHDKRWTALVVNEREPLVSHPNMDHQLVLARLQQRLGKKHLLGYCQGCDWWVRFPTRESTILAGRVFQHITWDHFSSLIDDSAVIDPDLVDGGAEYLAKRMAHIDDDKPRVPRTAPLLLK